MKRYEPDDVVTFYFVVMKSNRLGTDDRVQAWTDDKDLMKVYLDFHKCPLYYLKKITKPMSQMMEILDENNNDEINMYNITVRDPKHPHQTRRIVIPATVTEQLFINEEVNNFMMSQVDYGFLSTAIPYLKPKYQKALDRILMSDIIKKNVFGGNPPTLEHIQMDQLMVLLRSFPDHFGV